MNTIPERFVTLQIQVDKLREGTNPVVFFPYGTSHIPKLPEGCHATNKGKHGTFYYNPKFLSERFIDECIKKDKVWALLGFVQKKEDIKGIPVAITVRDMNANEIKTAMVDGDNKELVALQAYIFGQWFPNCVIEATTMFHIIAERLAEERNV